MESHLATSTKAGRSCFRLAIPIGHAHLPEDLIKFDETPIGSGGIDIGFSRRAIADELANAFEGSGTVSVDDTSVSVAAAGVELAAEREANGQHLLSLNVLNEISHWSNALSSSCS